jgi:hypothetical protein
MKIIAQNVAQTNFVINNLQFKIEKKKPEMCPTGEIKKTAQNKRPPTGRKNAQSGHPGRRS